MFVHACARRLPASGALEKSCEAAAALYQKYANLCIKDGALAHGRITFEQGQVREEAAVCLQGGPLLLLFEDSPSC